MQCQLKLISSFSMINWSVSNNSQTDLKKKGQCVNTDPFSFSRPLSEGLLLRGLELDIADERELLLDGKLHRNIDV